MTNQQTLSRLIGEGRNARRKGRAKSACPYIEVNMFKRHAWLAGWHDQDIELAHTPFTDIDAAGEEAKFLRDKAGKAHCVVDMGEHFVVVPADTVSYAEANIMEIAQ